VTRRTAAQWVEEVCAWLLIIATLALVLFA
jgi:hypothetical protein